MKTKIFIFVGLMLMLMLPTMSAVAQDEPELCSAADSVNAQFGDGEAITTHEAITKLFDSMTQAAAADDMKTYLELSLLVRQMLTQVDVDCRGLHFTSDEEGLKAAIGPVTFPDGTWRVSLAADGMLGTVKLTDLGGTCYDFISTILTTSENTIEHPAEVIVKLKGCEAVIEVEVIGGKSWDLQFEPLKLD